MVAQRPASVLQKSPPSDGGIVRRLAEWRRPCHHGRTTLFEGDYQQSVLDRTFTSYDVAPDDKHFVMLRRAGNAPDIVVWTNWLDELRVKTRQR
jgi:hypothetical protein